MPQRVSDDVVAGLSQSGAQVLVPGYTARRLARDLRDARAENARLAALLDAVRPTVGVAIEWRTLADTNFMESGLLERTRAAVDALPAEAREWADNNLT